MTLVASCGGIYFPETPVENILTLTWQVKEGSEAAVPYGSVVFKVKSSSPKSFYVHPRYGALLVSDGLGLPRDPCSTQVTFGLRPAATEVLSEAAATTAPRSATSIGVGNGYHERIVIEYIHVSGDRAIYDRLSQGLAADSRLSEVVRGVWDLMTGGTLHATRGTPITLKVYTECVTRESGKKGDGVVVVVPPTAKLVPPALREQLLNRMSTAHAREISTSSTAPSASEKHTRGAGTSELRALKLGIDALRNEPEAATTAAPVATDDTYNSSSKNIPRLQADHTETDILMRMPKLDSATTKGSKDGVPLFMVLAAMLFTYVITMLLWRTI
ncbi:hypothetical protein C3747_26g204 [Trypanosoma cruzi]|uniref:Uncharacterized protein n=2 Tax=Trypanosoma cruzi TaxID=5693 RepID=Q4DJM3_TRYCC|nr:hypothetical protein, conserved [Trypanosoma cruzi]EAN92725.1 hypothetical protein, conserved [Trypanosoma cruzi]KAF8303167.1 hypothetical protein TcYC6_0042090 [Trypanosoma cruzi]PWV15975.1 hypothetical protein C3747_26g204 [Trypanosoma cruzi]RNC54630.1 hypothetical protein TcCL_ESM07920 [Trypanosoma cruzi]|eukprot:XP_814576.1 hypothetical protein [Trypanosoma cruzi strain CL Brener]